jgi:hypothetical protein
MLLPIWCPTGEDSEQSRLGFSSHCPRTTTLPDMTNGSSFSLGPRGLLNCEFMLQNNGQAPTRHGRPVELNTVGMPARSENACCQVNGKAAKVARKKFGSLFASRTWSCPNGTSPRRSDSSHTASVLLRHVMLG